MSELTTIVSERWRGAATRLALSSAAMRVGEVALAAVMGEREPLTRAGLLQRAEAAGLSPDEAFAGLTELGARRVLVAEGASGRSWLEGGVGIAARVHEHVMGVSPSDTRRGVMRALLPRVDAALPRSAEALLLVVRGLAGSGRDTVLEAWLAREERDAVIRTPEQLRASADPLEPEVSGRVPVWDARGRDLSPDDLERAGAWLGRGHVAVALVDMEQDAPRVRHDIVEVRVDPENGDERAWVWRTALGPEASDDHVRALASELRVGIGHAVRVARRIAHEPTPAHARSALAALIPPSTLRGVRVERPDERLADLVLDERTARGLGHALALARHHDALSGRRRAGMTMLLTGPPGTGKTMAARALATELERPLHHVDLASTVSKWLGETEKNLARALRACEAIGGVLLFDEGEALFGERGEVSRGADRYANLEVAYLLQALEAHEGIVVVTTNAPDKIDGAFLRRFDLVLELPPPDATCRAALLQRELGEAGRALPPAVFARVAEQVELSGGHLAAAARLARTLARGAGRTQVHEADVLEALAFEQEKRGDLLSAARLRGDAARAVVAAP